MSHNINSTASQQEMNIVIIITKLEVITLKIISHIYYMQSLKIISHIYYMQSLLKIRINTCTNMDYGCLMTFTNCDYDKWLL